MVLPRWAVELAQERLANRRLQDATVGARIYDPDGCGGGRIPRRRRSGGGPGRGGGDRGPAVGCVLPGRVPRPGPHGPERASRPAGRGHRRRPGPGVRSTRIVTRAARATGGSVGSRFSDIGVRAPCAVWRFSPFSWWAPSTCCCGARSSGGSKRCGVCRTRSRRATNLTTSGIYGRITRLGESDADLEIAPGTVIHVARGAIGQRINPDEPMPHGEQHDGETGAD